MSDQSVEDYLKAEELFAPVLKVMLSLDPADMTYSSLAEAKAHLERILNQGKIIGRRTALTPGVDSVIIGQVWRCAAYPAYLVKVTSVARAVYGPDIVLYRHLDCGCPHVKGGVHENRSGMHVFTVDYEPVEEYDALIEGWKRCVDGA